MNILKCIRSVSHWAFRNI